MKKSSLLILMFALNAMFISVLSAQEMTYSNLRDGNGISISMELQSYKLSSLNYKGEDMHEITLSGIFIPNDEGMPNLPRISKLIAIPKGAEVRVSLKNMETENLHNVNIAPALRIQPIPEEPTTDYVKNATVYSTDAFYPQDIYGISEVTSLRGFDAVIVGITPFQYNPVTKELIAVTHIELDVEYIGGTRDYGDTKYRSPWFDPILKNNILNYEVISDIEYGGKSAKNGTGCEYLIVIPNREDFRPLAEQIKEFRTKQGIYTKIMRLDEMNVTNTTQLKTFFHNAYNTWDIPPVAVLLMGDHNTNMALGIPAETVSHPDYGSCISDNPYSDPTGDHMPDMVFSRMAAETQAQMTVLVSKFIEYETQPCMEPSYYQNPITALGWQTERWFQICSEAVGGYWRKQGKTPVRINAIYQGTPGSIWSSNQNTSMVVNYFGPSSTGGTGYIPATPAELGGWSGGTPAQVITAVNNGAFALQHRDHGFEDGWGEPAFQSPHISQLTNVGKMTYLFTINCLTGKFNHSPECFGEKFHRHTFNGQNAGCVGFLGPTEVSYSFVNDTYAWGMYDLFDPNFLPTYGPSYGPNNGPYVGYSGNWMPAFGNVSGKYFLYSSNWPYSGVTPYKVITYQMFTAHSDAFLRLFTEVPQALDVSHADVSLAGNPNFYISANAGALISLSAVIDGNLEILDVATATGSMQTMNIPSTLIPTTEINVVITGQNFLRYESVVTVVPAAGSYVIANMVLSTENTPYSGATVAFDLTLKNVGVETATGIQMNITTESDNVIIINSTAELASLAVDAEETLSQIFSAEIKNYVADGTPVVFNLNLTSNNNTFQRNITITVFAPKLELTNIVVTKATGSGNIAPGDDVNIDFNVANTGHAAITDVFSTALSFYSGLELFENEQTIEQISAGENQHVTFTGKVGNNVVNGSMIPVHFYAFKGTYTAEATGYMIIGSVMEDFETGNFLKFNWEQGTNPWEITNSNVYQGTYSARSKSGLGNSAISQLKMTTYTPVASTVSYARRVSSEANYDFFKFYIDNNQKEQLSGTSGTWGTISFPVEAGTHTYTFEYSKDASQTAGSDCAWVDNITIPGMGVLVTEDLPKITVINHSIEGLIGGIFANAADITFNIKNIGVANANNVTAELTSNQPGLLISTNQEFPFSLNINQEKSIKFNLAYSAKTGVEYIELLLKISIEGSGTVVYYPVVLMCVASDCAAPVNLSVAVEGYTAVLTWEDSEEMEGTLKGYNVFRDGIKINTELVTEKTYRDENLPLGTYKYQVNAVYEDCTSALTGEISVPILHCEMPTNLAVNAEEGQRTAVITWSAPENTDGLLGYNIYRDGTKLNETPLTETEYSDENLENGTYIYKVSAVYEHCESGLTEGVTVVIDVTNINNIQTTTFQIFPNPAHNELNITGNIVPNAVRLYNITGQLVYETVQCTAKMKISVSTIPSGVYFIKIDSDDGSVTQKVILN